MNAGDGDSMLTFARSLPENDLLFTTIDLTTPEAIDYWVRNIESGSIITILAEVDGKLAGFGTLHHNRLFWTRHLGEVELLIDPKQRGLGLGKLLANEIFALSQEMSLRKLISRMASEQRGAIRVFEHLGFHAEALLADHVISRDGRTHDLVLMAHDITGFTE